MMTTVSGIEYPRGSERPGRAGARQRRRHHGGRAAERTPCASRRAQVNSAQHECGYVHQTSRPRSRNFVADKQLCVALYSASHAMPGSYRARLASIGLTYSQYMGMLVVWEHGTITLGFLVEQLHLDTGTLSPLLKRPEHQGLLTRDRRVDDERPLQIACTIAGGQLYNRAAAVQAQVQRATGLDTHRPVTLRAG